MQSKNLPHNTSELIFQLKVELDKFKISLNMLIKNVEIKFEEIISKLIILPNYSQQLVYEKEIVLDDSVFHSLVKEMNNLKDQQYHHLILNKLRRRIKFWNNQYKKILNINTDDILQINEVCSFDNILKQNQIIKVNNKQVKLEITQTDYCFAFLDKPIQNQRIQQFLFQINNFTKNVGIGFANVQIIKDNQFIHKLELDHHGAYLCLADKSIRHHTDLYNNRKQIGITMNVGDIIQLTFNPLQKSVTWKNLNNKEQFSTKIDNLNGELRVCVALRYKNTIIQISDDESMIE